MLEGTLSGSTGASFQLNGQVENGIGYGTCAGTEGIVYFEAYAEGDDLTLSLVEPDEWGAPDYNKARYLQFKKSELGQESSVTGAITGALGLGAAGSQEGSQSSTAGATESGSGGGSSYSGNSNTSMESSSSSMEGNIGATGSSTVTENEVGDPSWGIKFGLPEGWVQKQSPEGAIVGHNTIAGMVLVMPHMSRNMNEMQAEMEKGLQEEGSYMILNGNLEFLLQNILSGDFSGVADGTQVKARGFGILSPNGGGAYLIAVSTPDKLGQELIGAAEAMINSVQYFKVDVDDLIQHFAGNWTHHSSNTSTWICFCPDGSYSEQYESSYSGDFNDGAGNYTGDWNAMSQDSEQGRWTVRGNKDSGTIIVKLANGNEINYQYQVHIEDGQKYFREYRFNGDFYSKSK